MQEGLGRIGDMFSEQSGPRGGRPRTCELVFVATTQNSHGSPKVEEASSSLLSILSIIL